MEKSLRYATARQVIEAGKNVVLYANGKNFSVFDDDVQHYNMDYLWFYFKE